MRLKEADLKVVHVRGSGPGGQNRNKRMSGVRVIHLPTGLVVTATERRSQDQNHKAALERLEAKLEAMFHKDAPRVATKPSRSSAKRRLSTKKQKSQTKQSRRITREDW